MKRLYTTGIAILALLALVGCNDIKEFAESPETTIVLTATREGVSPDTKSVHMEDGSTWWNPKEEISVFYGSGSNGGSKFISKNTTLAETTEFEGLISMSGSQDFWAVYPYSTENSCDGNSITTVISSEQTGVEGNFSGDVFPAMGRSNSLTMPFYNICGGIKFFVSRSDIKSVTFKGNNGETLAGKVKVAFGYDGKPEVAEIIEGQKEVTLTYPDGGAFRAGKYYYITLLPASLEGGFTMTFTTASETGTLTSDKTQTVKRSVFGTLKNIDSKVSEWKSSIVEPEYVDLGLSVKWATFNVGATKPEEYGDYFAWGETDSKEDYSWLTYKWCNGGLMALTKYCTSNDQWYGVGSPDNKTVLVPEDDAASLNWGSNWRMPTDEEWTELRENCTCAWTDNYNETGIAGLVVTASNSNGIFLPASGWREDPADLSGVGSDGFYWSSSLNESSPSNAWFIYFGTSGFRRYDFTRRSGYSIRPVYGEFIPVSSISLSDNSVEMSSGETILITVNVLPSNATEKSVRWVSSDASVATVDGGKIEAVSSGTAVIYAYSSNGLSASCMVSVKANLTKPDSVEAVDLGLPSGLKWASCNVGAAKPEGYGEHFAWGETDPKEDYSWMTYKWCNGDCTKLTKYCTNSSYWDSTSQLDNKTVLDPEDDAACANWGGSWRMPTDAEWTELRENSTWTWTYDYNGTGIAGQIVTSNMSGYESKSIFLPASGYRVDTDFYYAGYGGYYRSSSLYTDDPINPWLVNFYPDNVYRFSGSRSAGFSVRPVYGEFIPVSSITIDKESLELTVGDSAPLTATISPSNATAPTVYWVSGDESIIKVDQGGKVTALSEGSTTITAYASNGLSESCEIMVKEYTDTNGYEYVDLGLPSGLKWATCNVGANNPEESGDLYAWGEVEIQTKVGNKYYRVEQGTDSDGFEYTYKGYVKYITKSGAEEYGFKGFYDDKTVLDLEDDVAHVILGGSWRMPTKEECAELLNTNYCSWEYVTYKNVKGYKVTSKKDGYTNNWIFLPTPFWASSLDLHWQDFAEALAFNWSYTYDTVVTRTSGLHIRAVSK